MLRYTTKEPTEFVEWSVRHFLLSHVKWTETSEEMLQITKIFIITVMAYTPLAKMMSESTHINKIR